MPRLVAADWSCPQGVRSLWTTFHPLACQVTPKGHRWYKLFMSRKLLVRFVVSQPRPERDAKGNPKPTPRIDEARLLAAVQENLTPAIHQKYGPVELQIVPSKASEIRLDGAWVDKATNVREAVGEMIGEVMDGIDITEFMTHPA